MGTVTWSDVPSVPGPGYSDLKRGTIVGSEQVSRPEWRVSWRRIHLGHGGWHRDAATGHTIQESGRFFMGPAKSDPVFMPPALSLSHHLPSACPPWQHGAWQVALLLLVSPACLSSTVL